MQQSENRLLLRYLLLSTIQIIFIVVLTQIPAPIWDVIGNIWSPLILSITLLAPCFFYRTELKNSFARTPTLFGIKVPIIPLPYIIFPCLIGVLFMPFVGTPAFLRIQSVAIPILEELMARTPFLNRKVSKRSLIILALISAALFAIMHWPARPDLIEQLCALNDLGCQAQKFVGHFLFALIFSAITYRTGRLEIPIILHLTSNGLLRLELEYPMPYLIAISYGIIYFAFILGGRFITKKSSDHETTPNETEYNTE